MAKIVVLLRAGGVGFFGAPGDWSHFEPFFARRPGSPPLLPALAGAIVSGFFSFGGWWEASKLAGEVEDAPRNLPRALALGVLTVAMLYVAVSAVFLFLVPLEAVSRGRPSRRRRAPPSSGPAGAPSSPPSCCCPCWAACSRS